MDIHLLKPAKKLQFSGKHFQGYWVQVNTLIRKDNDEDLIMDGLLTHPMLDILARSTVDDNDPNNGYAEAVRQLYVIKNLDNPLERILMQKSLITIPSEVSVILHLRLSREQMEE